MSLTVGRRIEAVGASISGGLSTLRQGVLYVGGVVGLFLAIGRRLLRSLRGEPHRIRAESLVQQAVRVGVRVGVKEGVRVGVLVGVFVTLGVFVGV